MAEIRIRRVPEELKLRLKAEAKETGVDVRAVMLFKLWAPNGPPYMEAGSGTPGAYKGTSRGTKSGVERYQLPEWVPRVAWGHYEEMRRKIRKPMTETAKKLAVGELEKLRGKGQDPEKVLEQSVYRGWQGLFEVSEGNGNGQAGRKPNYAEQRILDNIEAVNELYPLDSGGGGEAGGAVERANAQAALIPVRRELKRP